MKKMKLFAATAMIAMVATAGYFGYTAYESTNMTDAERMMQANLEALTDGDEYHKGTDGTNWQTYTITCNVVNSSHTESSSTCVNCGASIPYGGVECSVCGAYSESTTSTTNYGSSSYKKDVCGSGMGWCFDSAPSGDPCAS